MTWLSMPGVGLPAVFAVSLLAATILPLGSEPVLLGYLAAFPEMFWPAILVATVGNTLGSLVSYAMGAGAHGIFGRWQLRKRKRLSAAGSGPTPAHSPESVPVIIPGRARAEKWVHRYGAPVLLLAWLPVIGDPLCAVAGWLRLPFWPCVVYIAVGKFGRYMALAWALRWFITPA